MTTSTNNRNSFIFYRSFFETIGDLNDADQLEIYRAIAEYSLNDKSVNLTGFPKTIFRLIEPQLQANKRRFKNGCLGAEHGAKGGRPKIEKTPKKPLKNPKLTPNKNNNVNPNHNPNEESESKIIIPNFLDASLWNSFLEMRKSKKAKPTLKAIELLVAKLTDFYNKGLDPNQALKNSIESNWTGVFEPKQSNQTQFLTADQRRRQNNSQSTAEFLAQYSEKNA